MNFGELRTNAALLAKDDSAFVNPRFAKTQYGSWVNEAYIWLAQTLPFQLILELIKYEGIDIATSGEGKMPTDYLRLRRFNLRKKVGVISTVISGHGRIIDDVDHRGMSRNTDFTATLADPVLMFLDSGTAGEKGFRLRPEPVSGNYNELYSAYVARPAVLALDADTPKIQLEHHYLIAELAASYSLVWDGSERAKGITDYINGKLQALVTQYSQEPIDIKFRDKV